MHRIDRRQILRRQLDVRGPGVLPHMRQIRRLRNRNDIAARASPTRSPRRPASHHAAAPPPATRGSPAAGAHHAPAANTPSPESRDPHTRAADRTRSRGCPDDTAPDWPHTPSRPAPRPVLPYRRCPNSTRPNTEFFPPPSTPRTPRPSPPKDARRASAANTDRSDPSSTVSNSARTPPARPARDAFCGSTLLTMNTRSRIPETACATTSSAPPEAYISAVSISVIPRSTPSRSAATSRAASPRRSPMYQVPCPSAGTVSPPGNITVRISLPTLPPPASPGENYRPTAFQGRPGHSPASPVRP